MRRITEACGVVLATGRPITMRLNPSDMVSPVLVAQKLRAVIRCEQDYPHRCTRGVLRRRVGGV